MIQKKMKRYFEKYPTEQTLLQVGSQVFLEANRAAAQGHAERTSEELVTWSREQVASWQEPAQEEGKTEESDEKASSTPPASPAAAGDTAAADQTAGKPDAGTQTEAKQVDAPRKSKGKTGNASGKEGNK